MKLTEEDTLRLALESVVESLREAKQVTLTAGVYEIPCAITSVIPETRPNSCGLTVTVATIGKPLAVSLKHGTCDACGMPATHVAVDLQRNKWPSVNAYHIYGQTRRGCDAHRVSPITYDVNGKELP